MQLLRKKLKSNTNHTYLWVHLTLDLIESYAVIDKAGIRNTTARLPQRVDEAYEKLLSRSPDLQQAKKFLRMVVAAERPLKLEEMALASALRYLWSYDELNIEKLEPEQFRIYILHVCGLLVMVEDLKIYLLH